MNDDLKIRRTFDAFLKAQIAFDLCVGEFKAAYDAAERASQAKAEAGKAMTAQLAEVDRLAQELADLGAAGPDIVVEEEMAAQIRKGRELGELVATLESDDAQKN